ncbi:hypothetical protein [Flammeovirga agarivorans]|uniref:DUF4412 domain-containing protein n=1 Tax=Flammeovirga agarivorans TaxID=2726742 RepID=A0A7X8SIU0_9BACT|nr:hypothetical protein [Flammeovirga agarivorans]NLR90996.1 hypothetical protein [Flammeovirga agarivorans]
MKLIQTLAVILLASIATLAQNYPFERQIIFEQKENGVVKEYPSIKIMVGQSEAIGARAVLEEDAGAQYFIVDFEKNKYLILMRQFGQKIAVESEADVSKLDVLGIDGAKVEEVKKGKKEILDTKCKIYKGTKDHLEVELYIGAPKFAAKGLHNLTKVMTDRIGIDLADDEMILGAKIVDKKNNGTLEVEATKVYEKPYKLSTEGYNTFGTGGMGFGF